MRLQLGLCPGSHQESLQRCLVRSKGVGERESEGRGGKVGEGKVKPLPSKNSGYGLVLDGRS